MFSLCPQTSDARQAPEDAAMLGHPYRSTPPSGLASAKESALSTPRGPALFVWLLSVVRVLGAVIDGERFGTEATLAMGIVILIPWLFRPQRSICVPSSTT